MATKKQMTETINRVNIVEDNMLNMEEHVSLLKEMVKIQNKHIEQMDLVIKELLNKKEKVEEKEIPIPSPLVEERHDGGSNKKEDSKNITSYIRRRTII